jgi:hypothetical protein
VCAALGSRGSGLPASQRLDDSKQSFPEWSNVHLCTAWSHSHVEIATMYARAQLNLLTFTICLLSCSLCPSFVRKNGVEKRVDTAGRH